MRCGTAICAMALLFGAEQKVSAQSTQESTVRELVQRAVQAKRPQPWASLLLRADAEAVKLERQRRDDCCDLRSLRIPGYGELHYRWNGLQQTENYEHELLRTIVRRLRGTPTGADALASLLALGPYGPWFDDDELLPDEFVQPALHHRIIAMLTSPSWLKLRNPALMKHLAEAYETWWSLSVAKSDDPELEQNGVRATDYATGAESARRKAVEIYESLLANGGDQALRSRVVSLRNRRDTHQRAWFRVGD
jgi:hypothetical protein